MYFLYFNPIETEFLNITFWSIQPAITATVLTLYETSSETRWLKIAASTYDPCRRVSKVINTLKMWNSLIDRTLRKQKLNSFWENKSLYKMVFTCICKLLDKRANWGTWIKQLTFWIPEYRLLHWCHRENHYCICFSKKLKIHFNS